MAEPNTYRQLEGLINYAEINTDEAPRVAKEPDNPSDAGYSTLETKKIFDNYPDWLADKVEKLQLAAAMIKDILAEDLQRRVIERLDENLFVEDIGLGDVENTSDADKPVSNDQKKAIDAAKKEAVEEALSKISVIEGPQGPQGEKGEKGDRGDQGDQGIQGIQGL